MPPPFRLLSPRVIAASVSAMLLSSLLVFTPTDASAASRHSSGFRTPTISHYGGYAGPRGGGNHGHRNHGGYRGGYGYGYGYGWFWPSLAVGLAVATLPFGYNTTYYGGAPYYYYDNVYYRPAPAGYVVVERPVEGYVSGYVAPPAPAPVVAAPPVLNGPAPVYTQQEKTGQLFAYPRNGQSSTTATFDRIECEKWGTQQTGFQPGQSPETAGKRSDYQRAVAACLEGRGYTVK